MTQTITRNLFIAIAALVLLIAAAQAKKHYVFNHVDTQFHFTLPEGTPDQYTQEFKLKMKRGAVMKFSFSDSETFASAYFALRPQGTFEIRNDGIVKNHGAPTTLVFKVSNKNPEKAGAKESATVYRAKVSKKIDLMRHKNAILIPLYIFIITGGIGAMVFTTVFVFLFAKKLMSNNRTSEKTALLSAAPTQAYSVSPVMYSHQPSFPVFQPIYGAVPAHSSMYPSAQPNAPVTQSTEKKAQQTNDNEKM